MMPNSPLSRQVSGLTEQRMLWIDFLRGLAALLVMVCHALDLSWRSIVGADPQHFSPLQRLGYAWVALGEFWVWCFFVISGFCIHQSIRKSLEKGQFRWKSYLLARASRIYPLFLLGLALAYFTWHLGLVWSGERPPAPWLHLTANVLNLQIFSAAFPNFEPSWSLSCEVLYYLAWPAVLQLCKGMAERALKLAVYGAFSVSIGISLLWQISDRLSGSAALNGLWTVAVLFPVWLVGVELSVKPTPASRSLWRTGVLMCLAMLLPVTVRFINGPTWLGHWLSWLALPAMIRLLPLGDDWPLTARWRGLCRWLGRLSYPCYLLHMPLLLLTAHWLRPWLPQWLAESIALYMLSLLLVVGGILSLCGPALETGVMRWRARWLTRSSSPSA
jgi:peptidoglycan/LPS O-acetylase OafA/YrhL